MSVTHKANASSHFKEIQVFRTEYSATTLTQYESTRTGMRAVLVDREGPRVDGFFTLATEIHDDSGAPHTLEHLCFMGSRSYKYKGLLEKLSSRAYSEINAWTATDHTAYELHSAGWTAFSRILPIYLEHIVLPTLTDAACYTEIHHVDGSGKDAGVVYSEMQAEENSKASLMWRKAKRLIYPEGVGFRSDTFGMMNSLRALSADRIRDYHHEMYQPKNLCLIIVGDVDHTSLLDVLDRFEDTILEDISSPNAPFKRPWFNSKQAPTPAHSVLEFVDFPEVDESSGEILISFLGPSSANKLHCGALNVLLRYLAGSSASVLEHTLVETEQIASGVYYETEYRPRILVQFTLASVATEMLEQVAARFLELLRETAAEPINLEYMRDCIERERRQVKFYAETSAQFFTGPIINDFLFGNRDGSMLKENLGDLTEYDTLETWDDHEWRHWLRMWLAEAHHAIVIGRPSADQSEKIEIEEQARIAARKQQLGTEGLQELEAKLAAAQTLNNKEIPKEVIGDFRVPDTASINFIKTATARSGSAREMGPLQNPAQIVIDKDKDLPLFVHFEHVQSNFVQIIMVLGTEVIPIPLRPLLAIYMDNFFNTPMLRDGKKIDFEQMIMELERDTVDYGMDSGQLIGNPETITIKLQVEVEKYQTAIKWLRDLIFSSIFDIKRIKSITTRMLAEVPDEKRGGEDMSFAAELMIGTAPASITRACSTLVGAVYLKRVRLLLKRNPDIILNELGDIRTALFQPSNWRVLVVANVERLEQPVTSWHTLIRGLDNSKPLRPLDSRLSRLSRQGRSPGNTAYVIPIPSVDSTYAIVVGRGPSSYNDPILPALMILTSLLNTFEGPLNNATRGPGLAYDVRLQYHLTSGQVSLCIDRAANALGAFVACKEVVQAFVSGEKQLDTFSLEGAISSIVYGFANAEATVFHAAESSFMRQVIRGLPKDWPTIILEQVRQVKVEEILDVMRDVVLPIFEGKTANLFITCAPVMEKELATGFKEIGFEAEVKPLDFFQDDYDLERGENTDEDDDDDVQDDDDSDSDSDDDNQDDNDDEDDKSSDG